MYIRHIHVHVFHILQCGEMTDIRLVKTIKGKSKGYAYVEFKDEVSFSTEI